MNTANASHKSPRKALVLCLLAAALSAAFLFESALAQEAPEYEYVDLVMRYEQGPSGDRTTVRYSVQNLGNTTATAVTISFLLEDLEVAAGNLPSSITDSKTVDGSNQTFTWDAGTIPPGGSSQGVSFPTKLHSAYGASDVPKIGVINATASSRQSEPDLLLPTNVIKIYSYVYDDGSSSKHMGTDKLGLLLSVSDLHPESTGDSVDFTLTARNMQGPAAVTGSFDLIGDISIKVKLSDGLELTGDGFGETGSRSETWRPDPVDKSTDPLSNDIPQFQSIVIKTQLTSESLETIPLEERCITAWVEDSKPPPNPGYVLGRLTQCLDDDPPVLINSGEIDLLTVHQCVKVNNKILYPCRDSGGDGTIDNTLELVAELESLTSRPYRIGLFGAGSGSGKDRMARPKNTVVQIKDPQGRRVSSGSIVWNSGSKSTGSTAVGLFSGPILDLSLPSALTSGAGSSFSFSISDMTTGGKPGTLKVVGAAFKTVTVLDPDHASQPTLTFTMTAEATPLWYEFGALGTYKMNITIGHSSGSPSGLYTFHVGPIAELEVWDGGRNPTVPAGQRAYTVMAVNNGPDTAPNAQVTLTGVPDGATAGSTSEGSYDPATRVWTIGKLETAEYRRASGQREGATLTLLTGAAEGTEITATIANTKEYEVCIDSSGADVDAADETACTGTTGNTWHTTKYYDYNEDNSKDVTIAARPGSGGSLLLRTSQSTVGIALSWPPQEGAAAYGIEVSEDGGVTWRPLEPWRVVKDADPGYTHTGVPVGATRHYRVHAIDSEGRRGLPFASSSASALAGRAAPPSGPAGPPMNVSAARSETDPAGTIKVSWDAPLNDGGSRITGYQAQWSATGAEGWSDACSAGAAERSCEHTGLSGDGPRYYRVAARNARGLGAWSHPPAEVARQPGDCDVPAVTADGTPVAGSWGEDCESAAREGSQARYYQFTLAGSADVTVRLESDGARPALYLRKGAGVTSGAPIGFNEGEAEYGHRRASIKAGLTAGTYTIEATTYAAGETGDFSLTVRRPGDCEVLGVTAGGTPVAASWGDDCESAARQGRQARYYQFTLADSADVTVRLASDDARPALYLRKGAGVTSGATTPGGFNDGEPEYDYRRASIKESLEAGTYTIEATTYAAGETGDFSLTVRRPGDCEVPGVTADGSPVAGSWGGDCQSAAREGRQARYYQFTLAESAEVIVRLASDDAGPVLYLREGAGVTSGATTPGGFNDGDPEYDYRRASIEESLAVGTYTIEATTFAAEETGDFILTVSQAGATGVPAPSGCEVAEVTADGSPVSGSWGGDCESTAREGRQARYYQFTLTENADITVRLESDDAETVLYLREGAGVTTGATTPGGFNDGEQEYDYHRASIEESLEAGTYTIEATTYAAGETGDFTLTVSGAVGTSHPVLVGCEAVEVTVEGSPVAGSWGADCESVEREGRQARYYQFALAENADVTVRLESDDAETVLYLREGAGLTSGATTPGGFNDGESEYNYRRASIEESLEAGTYTIEATTYAAGETGSFTLTVSRAGGTGSGLTQAAEVTSGGSQARTLDASTPLRFTSGGQDQVSLAWDLLAAGSSWTADALNPRRRTHYVRRRWAPRRAIPNTGAIS